MGFIPSGRTDLVEKDSDCITIRVFFWQGLKDSNPRHAVLETAALPTELYPYGINVMAEKMGFEPMRP